ncbi:OmpA family protein [Aquicoccus sp. SCR17]|nr:OmpA family protein [Carideicomes alvinocaridis]
MASALALDLPLGARLTMERQSESDSYPLPTAPWDGGTVPALQAEGAVTRQAWRIPTPGLTTLQIMAPLRAQLRELGYEIVFECNAETCGGFDFRFGTEVLPAPEMHVDLTRFRFLSATRAGEDGSPADYVSLLVSRNIGASFLQVVHVAAATAPGLEMRPSSQPDAPVTAGPLAQELEARGHVILGDLTFQTGSSSLGEGDFASLRALAEYLAAHPDRQVALVGHTDSVGGLEPNIALSRRRAASVADRLVAEYGAARAQISAEGMGYLAPVASNLTQEGREANRRVEAVLVSSE